MLLYEAIEYWSKRSPENVCLIDERGETTYREAQDIIEKLSEGMGRLRLPFGTRVALTGGNVMEVPLVIFAASRAGLIPVPLNARLSAREFSYILKDAEVGAIFAPQEMTETLNKALGSLDASMNLYCWGGRAEGQWRDWEELLSGGSKEFVVAHAQSDEAFQIYTSGTSGAPKGVVHTHQSITNLVFRWQMAGMRISSGEVFYLTFPSTLMAGLTTTFATLYAGGALWLSTFNAPTSLEEISRGKVGATALAPTMIQLLLDADEGTWSFEDLKWIFYGAAPMPVPLLQSALKRFDCSFFQGYGQTELPAISMLTPEDHSFALRHDPQILKSVGRAQIGCSIRIVNELDEPVGNGEKGEVCVTYSPLLMKEYWQKPDLTSDVGRNGLHHTGDLGLIDDNGYLYLIDRLSNMIITGGLNVYPREVEVIIEEFESIASVAVFAVPDDLWGQRVCAAIVKRTGEEISISDLETHCREALAHYKVPKSWTFLEAMPLNANGKVDRTQLQDIMQSISE